MLMIFLAVLVGIMSVYINNRWIILMVFAILLLILYFVDIIYWRDFIAIPVALLISEIILWTKKSNKNRGITRNKKVKLNRKQSTKTKL